jgi:hypothetical protein
MHRLARLAIPQHGRLALIRDPDPRDVGRGQPGLPERFLCGLQLRRPNLGRVVLHPAGVGKDLPKLLLRRRDHVAAVIEHDRARARRALVERQDVLHTGHHSL